MCPECKQSDSRTTKGRSTSVCKTCKRFVQTASITTLESPAKPVGKPPVPPSKYLNVPVCRTCLRVPGYLYLEYLQFFPACPVCGHLTDVLLKDFFENEGAVSGVRNDGKSILAASKEFKAWCAYVAQDAHTVVRNNSKKSIASSISSTASASLRRRGAVRRTPTNSTTSSVMSDGQPKLIPVVEVRQKRPSLWRRFSFEAASNPDPSAARMAAMTPKRTFAKTPFPAQAGDTNDEEAAQPSPSHDDAEDETNFVSVSLETPMPRVPQRPCFETRDSASKFHTPRPEVKRTFSEILGPRVQEEEDEPEPTLPRQPSARFLLPRFLQGALFSTSVEGNNDEDA
jgi:hypothetical protein